MGNGIDVLVAMFIAIVVVLAAMTITQWLIESKFPKYWYVLPSTWFGFILLSSLFGFLLQSHKDAGASTYIGLLIGILVYSSPAFIPLVLHFFLDRKRKKENPEDN
ncbi:MAG: hypothetical protein WBL80_10105 [Erysipelotrichaceae bacterium]